MRVTAENLKKLRGEDKILSFSKMPEVIRRLYKSGLTVVLAQGCYDIVHRGHVEFMRAGRAIEAEKSVLIAGLENDKSIRKNKGSMRPINPLEDRQHVLAEFLSVGLVFGYDDAPDYENQWDYIRRYQELGPALILVPTWDPQLKLKQWQAKKAGTELVMVDFKHYNSTSLMLKKVGFEE
jgi:cytidyltransferase-like protein